MNTFSDRTNDLATLTTPVVWLIAKLSVAFPTKEYKTCAFVPTSWSVHTIVKTSVPLGSWSLSLSSGLGLRNTGVLSLMSST